jgi:hypothetical protein
MMVTMSRNLLDSNRLRLKLATFVDPTDARRAVARVGPTNGPWRIPRHNFTILRHAIDSANLAEKALIHP